MKNVLYISYGRRSISVLHRKALFWAYFGAETALYAVKPFNIPAFCRFIHIYGSGWASSGAHPAKYACIDIYCYMPSRLLKKLAFLNGVH
jgi:hypothetical protein